VTPTLAGFGVGAVAVFAAGAALVRTREWSCKYRYWSDGSHNAKPELASALAIGGIVLGIVVAGIGIRRYRRTHRPIDLLVVAVGLIPLIAALTAVLLLRHSSWAYDCSTG
jgi:hypothetical protein